MQCDSGQPAWGRTAAIYESELNATAGRVIFPIESLGSPRFTMTVFRDKLLARMGSTVTGQSRGTASERAGCLVCLDLAAEGRLLWKIAPEEGWAFEGTPLADDRGVYVAMRRQDIRPQAFVACFDADTGRFRWRRFICGAESPARGVLPEQTHNLLTLASDTLYYNTNLGAVAGLRTDDGRVLWISLYPRALRGDLANLTPHWRRELNPCLLDRGTLLVAPADSPRIFAFDAATGQILWQTGTEVEDAAGLLGAAGDWLIAGGSRLYWISLREEDRGRVKHVWPDGPARPGYGRGILAGQDVLWSTRDKLYIFNRQTARPRRVVDLGALGASGGNLLVAHGRLFIATQSELIALGTTGGRSESETLHNAN
jgi:outer membrane protein assembly factor BamB